MINREQGGDTWWLHLGLQQPSSRRACGGWRLYYIHRYPASMIGHVAPASVVIRSQSGNAALAKRLEAEAAKLRVVAEREEAEAAEARATEEREVNIHKYILQRLQHGDRLRGMAKRVIGSGGGGGEGHRGAEVKGG